VKFSIKHIGLVIGVVSVLLSFLFFGRQHDTYLLMLTGGLLISMLCFLWILFGKESSRSKLFWVGVVALGIFLNWVTESFLRDTSYRIFIQKKNHELASINNLLRNIPGEVWIMRDSVTEKPRSTLSIGEKQQLNRNFEKLGVYMILKRDSTIYYGLWGFLDVRLGVTYVISGRLPQDQYRHLLGNWYH
jgi:energy-coupling factor transporter transmembrane protein EcfT